VGEASDYRVMDSMGSRRLRISAGVGIFVGVLIALSAIASGTQPALAVLGAIPPGVIVGFGVFLLLPALGLRR